MHTPTLSLNGVFFQQCFRRRISFRICRFMGSIDLLISQKLSISMYKAEWWKTTQAALIYQCNERVVEQRIGSLHLHLLIQHEIRFTSGNGNAEFVTRGRWPLLKPHIMSVINFDRWCMDPPIMKVCSETHGPGYSHVCPYLPPICASYKLYASIHKVLHPHRRKRMRQVQPWADQTPSRRHRQGSISEHTQQT